LEELKKLQLNVRLTLIGPISDFEIPKTAGMESIANTRSIVANRTTTTNRVVYTGFPFSFSISFPFPSCDASGKYFFRNLYTKHWFSINYVYKTYVLYVPMCLQLTN
ncbi:MAG: hypothetical protein RIS64_3501, partial [Bacteroidota bacterium]